MPKCHGEKLSKTTKKAGTNPRVRFFRLIAIPLAGVFLAITTQRDAFAQKGSDWSFGNCYNQSITKYPNYHYQIVTWCNCLMKVGPTFDYNSEAVKDYCNRDIAAQNKAREDANSRQLIERMLPSMLQVPNFNQNSSGAIDALGRAFGLPSANSVTCRPIYGYDGYYQGTRCE